MKAEPKERQVRDAELNESLEAYEDELGGLSIKNQRFAKIDELEEAALASEDPLNAVIGLGNVYFQRFFEHYGAALLDAIDTHPHTLVQLRQYDPDIRLLIKLRNAMETDREFQAADVTSRAPAFPPGLKGKGLNTGVGVGKRDLLPKQWPGKRSH